MRRLPDRADPRPCGLEATGRLQRASLYVAQHAPNTAIRRRAATIDTDSIPTTWPYLQSGGRSGIRAATAARPLRCGVTEFRLAGEPEGAWAGRGRARLVTWLRSYLLSRRANAVRVLFWYDLMDERHRPEQYRAQLRAAASRHVAAASPALPAAAAVLSATLCQRPLARTRRWTAARSRSIDTAAATTRCWRAGRWARRRACASIRLRPGRYIQRRLARRGKPGADGHQPAVRMDTRAAAALSARRAGHGLSRALAPPVRRPNRRRSQRVAWARRRRRRCASAGRRTRLDLLARQHAFGARVGAPGRDAQRDMTTTTIAAISSTAMTIIVAHGRRGNEVAAVRRDETGCRRTRAANVCHSTCACRRHLDPPHRMDPTRALGSAI